MHDQLHCRIRHHQHDDVVLQETAADAAAVAAAVHFDSQHGDNYRI